MKYIKSSILAMAALAMPLLNSCDALDEDLTGQPTTDKFFNTLTDFNSFIAGAYTPLYAIFGSDAPYVATAGGEDVNVSSVVRWRGFENCDITTVSNPDEITDVLWNNSYASISACNTLISLVAQNDKLAPESLEPIEGEARFLRAMSYFNMVRWFGEIPVLTEDNQSNATQEPQSPVADIYDFIVSDLKEAERLLPENVDNPSKPCRLAASALLAKVYLTMAGFPLNRSEHYASAREKARSVIESGRYSLQPTFLNLWLFDHRYTNGEFIFTLYASSDNGTGGYVNRAVRPVAEGGWADWTSDRRFMQTFPGGARFDGTFYLNFNDGSTWQDEQVAEPYVGKLRDGGPKSGGYYGSSEANLADGFYCMLRYADILLIYAEAANLAEGTPSAEALKALNDVRERAGLDAYGSLSHEAFDKAVLDERNWELAFECNRWFDLCRRHMVADIARIYSPSSSVSDNNYLLPKPNDQLAIMLGVTQNPGYNR